VSVAYDWKTELPGVFSRHADSCPVRDGGECTCGPLGFRASVREWDTNKRSVSQTFDNVHEALAWQQDQLVSRDASRGISVERGELGTLIDEFLQAAEDGMILDGSRPYSRESIRALRGALSYVDSELGTMDVQDVRRRHVQALLDQLRGSGLPPVRVVAVAAALDSLYAYAIKRDLVGFNPVVALELPESANGVAHATPAPAPAPVQVNGAAADSTPPAPWPPPSTQPAADAWTPQSFPAYDGTSSNPPTERPEQPGPGYPPPGYPTPPDPYAPPPGTYPMPTGPYATGPYPTPPPSYPPPGTYPTPPGLYATPPYQPPYTGYTTPYPGLSAATGGYPSGPASAIFGATTAAPDANYDATMQERWLWWTVRIIVIVFVLIALVLVAESV
jgi:hypothetical protein